MRMPYHIRTSSEKLRVRLVLLTAQCPRGLYRISDDYGSPIPRSLLEYIAKGTPRLHRILL